MTQTQTGIRFVSAMSSAPQTPAAVAEVAGVLSERLNSPADLVVVFASMHHREGLATVYATLQEALGPRVLLACTCEGVIGVHRELEEGAGLSVLAGRLPGATLSPFCYEQIDWPAVLASPTALKQSIGCGPSEAADEPKAVLLLADPFSTPMVKLLPAFDAAFPGVPVVGGMASGGRQPGQNRLMLNGTLLMDGAVGLAIGGGVSVQTTVSQGCRPVGQPMVITKAQRHVVQELGGRNALQALQEMAQELDRYDQELVQGGGLLVGRVIDEYKGRFGRGDFLIRGLVGVDPDVGYVAIGDPQVRVGQTIQFQLRDQKTAAEDFAMLLEVQKVHGPAAGALLVTCNGRGSQLFDRPDADAALVHDALGDVPLAGFFAAGELGPVGQENFVHGHTASLTVFRESV